MTNEERKALEDLIEAVEAAINAGDWKVDGACDPTLVLIRAKESLAQPDQDEVDIRSRLYQRIHELETQLAREEQEPVALQYPQKDIDWQREQQIKAQASIPPQRKPLTRERLVEMAYAQCGLERTFEDWVELFAREIETAHGIKE